VNPVSGMRGVNRPANCYVSSLAPYACHNEECPEYNLVKIIVLEEAGPSLLIEPRLICSVCSCVVPRVVWAVLDK
jgi:hypothetical protein